MADVNWKFATVLAARGSFCAGIGEVISIGFFLRLQVSHATLRVSVVDVQYVCRISLFKTRSLIDVVDLKLRILRGCCGTRAK